MTSTSLKSEACLGAQILGCGQLAYLTEGSTVQATRAHMRMGAMAQDQPPVSNSHKKEYRSHCIPLDYLYKSVPFSQKLDSVFRSHHKGMVQQFQILSSPLSPVQFKKGTAVDNCSLNCKHLNDVSYCLVFMEQETQVRLNLKLEIIAIIWKENRF